MNELYVLHLKVANLMECILRDYHISCFSERGRVFHAAKKEQLIKQLHAFFLNAKRN